MWAVSIFIKCKAIWSFILKAYLSYLSLLQLRFFSNNPSTCDFWSHGCPQSRICRSPSISMRGDEYTKWGHRWLLLRLQCHWQHRLPWSHHRQRWFGGNGELDVGRFSLFRESSELEDDILPPSKFDIPLYQGWLLKRLRCHWQCRRLCRRRWSTGRQQIVII